MSLSGSERGEGEEVKRVSLMLLQVRRRGAWALAQQLHEGLEIAFLKWAVESRTYSYSCSCSTLPAYLPLPVVE